jgi:hypothetical protein
MTRPESLLALMAYEQKVRLAVQVLLSADEGDLPDGLYGELLAFRDMLDLADLRNIQHAVKGAPGVPVLLAGMLREQIRRGVLREGMPLSVAGVARAYMAEESDARTALGALAGERLLAYGEHSGPGCYVVVAEPGGERPRNAPGVAVVSR